MEKGQWGQKEWEPEVEVRRRQKLCQKYQIGTVCNIPPVLCLLSIVLQSFVLFHCAFFLQLVLQSLVLWTRKRPEPDWTELSCNWTTSCGCTSLELAPVVVDPIQRIFLQLLKNQLQPVDSRIMYIIYIYSIYSLIYSI